MMSQDAAASALRWWADAGVDTLVAEEPRDWLRARVTPAPRVEPPFVKTLPAETLPDQLHLFQAWLGGNSTLPFATANAPRICPAGDPASGLMMMIDMPAAEDCDAGALLSGKAGRLFDRMLAAIGRDRASIYLASLSCLRSADGRFDDAAAGECARVARHHVGLARPDRLLLFGDACARALLGMPMTSARGRWHALDTPAGVVNALVTLTPAYLLDQPAAKRHAWADLKLLIEGPSR